MCTLPVIENLEEYLHDAEQLKKMEWKERPETGSKVYNEWRSRIVLVLLQVFAKDTEMIGYIEERKWRHVRYCWRTNYHRNAPGDVLRAVESSNFETLHRRALEQLAISPVFTLELS